MTPDVPTRWLTLVETWRKDADQDEADWREAVAKHMWVTAAEFKARAEQRRADANELEALLRDAAPQEPTTMLTIENLKYTADRQLICTECQMTIPRGSQCYRSIEPDTWRHLAHGPVAAQTAGEHNLEAAIHGLRIAGHGEYPDGHCRVTVFKTDVLDAIRQAALPDGTAREAETPMQALKGSLRGEETDAEFDQAVREIQQMSQGDRDTLIASLPLIEPWPTVCSEYQPPAWASVGAPLDCARCLRPKHEHQQPVVSPVSEDPARREAEPFVYQPLYSGDLSIAFWRWVGALQEDARNHIYALACEIQEREVKILALRDAEPSASPTPLRCTRCGAEGYEEPDDICDDPAAAGAGNAGICGGALEPIPPSASPAQALTDEDIDDLLNLLETWCVVPSRIARLSAKVERLRASVPLVASSPQQETQS